MLYFVFGPQLEAGEVDERARLFSACYRRDFRREQDERREAWRREQAERKKK